MGFIGWTSSILEREKSVDTATRRLLQCSTPSSLINTRRASGAGFFVNITSSCQGPDSRNDLITVKKRSLISRQLTIDRSDQIPRIILLWSNHDPSDPARHVDQCWIRNLITTIGHFISNITIVKIHKLQETLLEHGFLVPVVCIFSMTSITDTYLSNMVFPNPVVSWANTVCVQWAGHEAIVSALINDVATPPIVTSWKDIISLAFFLLNHDHVISITNFPVNDLCHDSIGNNLFDFVFSRSYEPLLICGMRSTGQDLRIVSEPTASGSFLESGPVCHLLWGRCDNHKTTSGSMVKHIFCQ